MAFGVGCLLLGGSAAGQTESLIQHEIESAKESSLWRLGSVWITPTLSFEGGYDSNGLSSAVTPVEDVALRQSTAIRVAAPAGPRVLTTVRGQLDLVYYDKLEILRDLFPSLRGDVTFGGKKIVFDAGAGRHFARVRPNSARDVLANQTIDEFDGTATLSLGGRQQLTADYSHQRIRLEDLIAPSGVEIPLEGQLDRTENLLHARLVRRVSRGVFWAGDASFKLIDFESVSNVDARSYSVVGGAVFEPRGAVGGQLLLGYKRITAESEIEPEFSGLEGAVDLLTRLGSRFGIRGRFSRDAEPSFFLNNRFIVDTAFGGAVILHLTPRARIEAGVTLGRNGYSRPAQFVDTEGMLVAAEIEDRRETVVAALTRELRSPWVLGIEASYTRRTSNVLSLNKDRFVVNMRFTSAF